MYSLSEKLNLNNVFPNKVSIWQLRCNNPMRKSFVTNNIKSIEFEALIKLAAQMSRYLYPYIREILASRDDFSNNNKTWNEFKIRYIELIKERFNVKSMRVKKLINQGLNDKLFIKILLTLSFSKSEDGHIKLRSFLFEF